MKLPSRLLLGFTISLLATITYLFLFSKPVHASSLLGCNLLPSIEVDGVTYAGNNINPVPEFKDFYLNIECTGDSATSLSAQLLATVNGQELSNYIWTHRFLSSWEMKIGPFNGVPGLPGPLYKQYIVTTVYTSPTTGLNRLDVTCSPCAFLVAGTGVRPSPSPTITPYTPNCPRSFKGYNPDPPKLNESFQMQYWLPSSGVYDGEYFFEWSQPTSGDKGTQSIDKSTAASYGIWIGTFTFNEETKVILNQRLVDGRNTIVKCDERTVFIGADGSGGTLTSGENPCKLDPADNKVKCITALGKIPTELKEFSSTILSIATGLAGGIAFILMVIGAIRVLMSQGDPQKLAGGREMLVAALAGLLFLIFSVLILRFIGINLLGGIPGIG